MERHPMTLQGAEALQKELDQLRRVGRPKIIRAIAEARAHGDLKENAEYHAAKEQQAFNEGRIHEIEAKLSAAQIIDISKLDNEGKVIFGATIEVVDSNADAKVKYQIVGEDEADIKQSKISFGSPIARALIGKFAGDTVDVRTPAGVVTYEIIQVEYI